MAKPPFNYKPTKAALKAEGMPLVGTEDVVAIYSDVFIIVNEGDTGMGSIYFYQRRLADRGISQLTLGETVSGVTAQAKCVGRVLLSGEGVQKLLEALAENRGYNISHKPTKEDKK